MFGNLRDKLSPYDLLGFIDKPSENLFENINTEEAVLDFQKRAIVVVQYDHSMDSFRIWKYLKEKLQNENDDVKARFREILMWLQYGCFNKLSQNQIIDFFKNENIGIILSDEFHNDLIGKIKLCLSDLPIEERDLWREKMYIALHENNSILSQQSPVENEKGTIAIWLRQYDQSVGIGLADALSRAEFENQAPLQAKLNQNEKDLLKKFLDLYEFIKYTSYVPAGFEEDMLSVDDKTGKTWILSGGEGIIVDFGDEYQSDASQTTPVFGTDGKNKIQTQKPFELQTVQNISITDSKSSEPSNKIYPQDRIIEESRRILFETKGDVGLVFGLLDKFLSFGPFGDSLGTLGALLLIAQLRKLDDILLDRRFYNMVSEDIKKSSSPEQNLEGLRVNPQAPKYIARFLKIALEDKTGLSTEDAVNYGARLGKVLGIEGEKYSQIVRDGKWGL